MNNPYQIQNIVKSSLTQQQKDIIRYVKTRNLIMHEHKEKGK